MISSDNFVRRRILHADIASGHIRYPTDEDFTPAPQNARVLVTFHDHPVGTIEIDSVTDGRPGIDQIRQIAWAELSDRLTKHLEADGYEVPASWADFERLASTEKCSRPLATEPNEKPLMSVVVCTMKNATNVLKCVQAILVSSYQNFEILVVDNRPEDTSTKELFERAMHDERVHYFAESRRGLSRARNRGLNEAVGEVVVFTDDDVLVDEHWLNAIAHNFDGRPEVACVTGSIVTNELETPAQAMLEQFGGFHKGSNRQIYDMGKNRRDTPLYPFDSGRFGSGANMAFRTAVLRRMGGYCEELGAGTPAHGGEDIDILRRVVWEGHTLVYEPAALMWHRHRRSYAALERQLFRYGVGLSATVTKWLLEDRRTAWAVLTRMQAGLRHVLNPKSEKNRRKNIHYPKHLTRLETVGLLVGPFAYLRSRAQLDKVGRVFDAAGSGRR